MVKFTPDDFKSPMFDGQTPQYRMVGRPKTGRKSRAIEGVTMTDGYNQVGYTCFLSDGLTLVNYWNPIHQESIRLIEEKIRTPADFEKLLKTADERIKAYIK